MNAENITKLLGALPISQRALAAEAGVSPSLLSQICSGHRAATPATLGALARALETLGDEFLTAAIELRKAAKESK